MGQVEAFLREKVGLDVASLGAAAISRAVRDRVEAQGLPDLEAYWKILCASEREQQELIEAVVVPETWFFRDREAFTALTGIVHGEWAERTSALRVLSLPCSTGEEPFSIAMCLLDSGLSPTAFQIDAVDISERAIAQAERGVYGKNSFRVADLTFRDRYFEPVAKGYRLSERVRQQVRFRQSNLFAQGAFPAVRIYDVIFCRNVLIYFDRPAQRRAIELLRGLSTPAGVLFVGPAEAPLLADHGFASARMPLAFAFRQAKSAPAQFKPVLARSGARSAAGSRAVAARWGAIATPSVQRDPPLNPTSAPNPGEDWVGQAQMLADCGKLAEAMECCERHLRQNSPSAQAFYLLGLLHDAAGQPQRAGEHYRKALYLDPTHHEALVHLAATLMTDGDVRGAERLFERARRAEPGARR